MERTRHRNIAMTAAVILLCLVLVTASLVGGMLARYTSSDDGTDSARAAAFVFHVDDAGDSRIINLSGVDRPGVHKSYTFIIKNNLGETVSEVAETANISLSLNGSIPLSCTVRESGQETDLVSVTRTDTGIDHPVTDSENVWSLTASVKLNKTYVLTVDWPSGFNSIEYASAGTVARLVMTVTGTQID